MTKSVATIVLALALTAAAKKPPASKPSYANAATVGMTEAEVRAAYDPELYSIDNNSVKGSSDLTLWVMTRSRGGSVGDGFHVVEGSKPKPVQTIKLSRKTGKVYFVSKMPSTKKG